MHRKERSGRQLLISDREDYECFIELNFFLLNFSKIGAFSFTICILGQNV